MRNGGEESTSGRPKAGDFGRSVSRMAVAQICESVGFEGFKESALDSLTEVAIRYLVDLSKIANSNANLSGRTQCNLFDIVKGFEEMGAPLGFSGASTSSNCVVSSGTVKEIIQFVDSSEEIPFAQPVPSFPVVRDRRLIPSFLNMNETPPGKHIPAWLPALPDPHTYIHTPMWNERVVDPRSEKIEQARQRRKAEQALLSLQQRLLSNGSVISSTPVASSRNVKEVGVGVSNPILSKPLKPGEKAVAAGVVPEKLKNNTSLVEAFAPAIEAAREGGFADGDENERKLLPEKRPAVNFKFKTGKKMLGEPLDLSLSRKGGAIVGHSLGREDERDDKKRRAEYILRQCMENPQELTQL
ncbi:transcription initiation factor TFIID subunit 8 [Mercurialis annua]|uniref:transcription initiation factor TFIID subunit 8 n=1 Tax=Mercurialis annua TaxID=3986 RepID=UPI00215F6B9E|nr:transcription initiation factor TFIID subunit 8 [Mercurialis annua]